MMLDLIDQASRSRDRVCVWSHDQHCWSHSDLSLRKDVVLLWLHHTVHYCSFNLYYE